MLTTCFHLIWSSFKKRKEVWNKLPWLNFCEMYEGKYFSHYICKFSKLYCLIVFRSYEILGNICVKIICCTVCDIINFEINLSFLMKSYKIFVINRICVQYYSNFCIPFSVKQMSSLTGEHHDKPTQDFQNKIISKIYINWMIFIHLEKNNQSEAMFESNG